MSEDKFRVKYEVEDGYVGGSRPHHFSISDGVLNGDEDDRALEELFEEELQRAFSDRCQPYSDDCAAFIEWARERIHVLKERGDR